MDWKEAQGTFLKGCKYSVSFEAVVICYKLVSKFKWNI